VKSRKRTDTGYPITATLKANGVAVDLTGSTVYITLRNRQTGDKKVNASVCAVTSAVNGQVSYSPVDADVDTAGVYDVEFKQQRPGGTIIHYPSSGYEPLTIEDSLA
jgi:hypothetical protein